MGSTPVLWGGGLVSSTVGLLSACCSGASSACRSGSVDGCSLGTPVACPVGISATCCPGTSMLSLDCSSMRVLRGGVCMFGGGATGFSSSSDHSSTVALRVEWSSHHQSRGRPFSFSSGLAQLLLPFFLGFSPSPRANFASDQRRCLRILTRCWPHLA